NIARRIPRAPVHWLSSIDAHPGDAPLHGRSERKDRILSVFRQATANTTVRLHGQAHSSNENTVSGPSLQVDYVPTSEDDPSPRDTRQLRKLGSHIYTLLKV